MTSANVDETGLNFYEREKIKWKESMNMLVSEAQGTNGITSSNGLIT